LKNPRPREGFLSSRFTPFCEWRYDAPMPRSQIFSWLRTALPAVLVALAGSALWLAVPHTKSTLVGWVLMMAVLGTVAALASGADLAGGTPHRWRALAGIGGVLFVLILILKLVVWVEAGLWEATWTASVAASWVALWGMLAWALRRRGAGVAVSVPLGLASVCLALPVAAMPLVRWAGQWGSSEGVVSVWSGRAVEVVAHACPFFAILSALKPAVRVDWGVLPGMYAWSGLGQEVPLEMPAPWVCGLIYASLAAAVWLVGRRGAPAA
jgi:hypothetical protein